MPRNEDEDVRAYTVVVNGEDQYSIWLADRPIPAGWRAAGKTGSKSECLAHIKDVWTDMRPLSLRKWMTGQVGPGAGRASGQ
jgi:MbtH protein